MEAWPGASWTRAGQLDDPGRPQQERRAHTLPLMPAALDIVAEVPRMASRDQLFGTPSRRWVCGLGQG